MHEHFLFEEKQRFTQWWLWLILVPIILLSVFWDYETTFKDPVSILIAFIPLILLVGLLLLFRLKTKITETGINLSFIPFIINKWILWEDITAAYVRVYKPIREYGGWGLRFGLKGTAYNVKGNNGLQLILKNGKKILIGTQKPNDIQRVLNQLNIQQDEHNF